MFEKAGKTEPARVYLLKGDDDYRKSRELERLLDTLVSNEFIDFDLEHLEGDAATSDRIMAGLSVPPFGSARRVVLVKYANKIHPDEQAKLASRLDKIPSTGCLVLVNPAAEKSNGKPKRGSEITGELSKAVRKVGQVLTFGAEGRRESTVNARQLAQELFSAAGKKIDSNALKFFIERVGFDSAVVYSEVRKLIDYAGDSEKITQHDISAVTSETPEEKVFKLIDAVAAGNRASALVFLNELFETGTSPDADAPRTLATLARQFRLIWQMKMLMDVGVRSYAKNDVPQEVKAALPSNPNILEVLTRQSWQADRLIIQAQRFSRRSLARCFNAIARADAMLKGAEGNVNDPKLVMELLIIDLLGGPRR